MKYTKQQAERLKNKGIDGYTRYDRPMPDVIIKDDYYIVESKLNKLVSKEPSKFWKEIAERQSEKMYSYMEEYAEYCTTHVLTSKIGHPYLSAKDWFEKFICNNQK